LSDAAAAAVIASRQIILDAESRTAKAAENATITFVHFNREQWQQLQSISGAAYLKGREEGNGKWQIGALEQAKKMIAQSPNNDGAKKK
jgi:hypothetical protein